MELALVVAIVESNLLLLCGCAAYAMRVGADTSTSIANGPLQCESIIMMTFCNCRDLNNF